MTNVELEELRTTWKARIVDFRASGQTGAAWCAANEIKEHQLWYWVKKFSGDSPVSQTQPHFIPVHIHEPVKGTEASILIHVGSITIEVKSGYNPELLSDVVRTLTSLC